MQDEFKGLKTINNFKIIKLFTVLIVFLFQSCTTETKFYNKVFKEQIVSLKSDKSFKGSFLLGAGTIEEVDYYYFFIKDTLYNGYKKHKIKSLETLIIEKDTIPTFVENKLLKQTKTKNLFSKETVDNKYLEYGVLSVFLEGIEIPNHIKYKNILYVPKGVITENVKWEAL